MSGLLEFVRLYGAPVIFVVVCLNQAGLPVPAYPTIIAACALAAPSTQDVVLIAAMSVAGALAADALWFVCGRRYGSRILDTLRRLIPSSTNCLHATERTYRRRGAAILLVARFVPGLSAAASTLAGTTGACAKRFAVADVIGTVLWVGVAVALGAALHGPILALAKSIARLWIEVLLLAAVAAAIAALVKWRLKRCRRCARRAHSTRAPVGNPAA